MSIPLIRRALEKRLAAVTPVLATAFENVAFSPVSGTPYQRVNLLPNTPDDAQVGSKVFFERGIFQVTLCYPMGDGPAACEARAQLVKEAFKRGTSLVEGVVTVNVMNAPSASTGYPDGDRFCVPISIRYQAQVVAP